MEGPPFSSRTLSPLHTHVHTHKHTHIHTVAPPRKCDSQLLAQPFHRRSGILLWLPAKRPVSPDEFTWVLIPPTIPPGLTSQPASVLVLGLIKCLKCHFPFQR